MAPERTHGEGEPPPSGDSWPIWSDTVAGEQDAAQDALLAAVLVIEEAVAREDKPASFPEPEPGAVLGTEWEERPERKTVMGTGTLGDRNPEGGEEQRHMD